MSDESDLDPLGAGEQTADDVSSSAGSSEQAADQIPTPPETLEEPSAGVVEPSQEPAAESRAGRFFRRALRWAVLALVIFALGFAATWVARVSPLQQEQNRLAQALSEAEALETDLRTELGRLEGVETENARLSGELDEAVTRLTLLSILVDVTGAQLALAQEDPLRVMAALEGTEDKLSQLSDLLEPGAASDLDGLQERLLLVIDEVETDPFAAERDLEVLANTLLGIERELAN